MASIWEFLDSLPKRSDVSPEELAARRQGYADLYQGGLLARNRDQMPLSVQGAQATQDFLPVIGDALALGEAGEALSRGELAAAGLLGAGAAIGLVPGAGDALAKPVMAAGRRAADIARRIEVDPNALGSMGGNIRLKPQAADEAPATGIRAYHGSPHSFDKFSMDAIGTGEGAQAYGHGLYFAEAEDVAKKYRDDLSGWSSAGAERTLEAVGGDVDRAILETQQKLDRLIERSKTGAFQGAERNFNMQRQIQEDKIAQLEKYKRTGNFDAGSMYEVNIAASPDDFLDYDAPLSEQPKKVRDFATARWQQVMGREPDSTIEGEYIAKMASPQYGIDGREWLDTGPAADQSKRLREAGILGIKYRDAGSRGIDGKGTRNYVVFDENLINIVKKYGIAGAAAMLGVSAMDVEQAMAQGAPQPQPQGLLGGAR